MDGVNGGYDGGFEVTVQSVCRGSPNQSAAVYKVKVRAIGFGA